MTTHRKDVPAGYHLTDIELKGTTAAVPALAVHRDSDHGVLGYLILQGHTWATLWASTGPKFQSTYGHRTRKAAVAQILAATAKEPS